MDHRNDDLDVMLGHIDPASVDYQTWVGIGMALKDAGYDVSVWDTWSARDPDRYHAGECEKKWRSFRGSSHPVTAGTIVWLAVKGGYEPPHTAALRALDWDDYIGEDYVVTSAEQTLATPVRIPQEWDSVAQITKYLETLFEPEDFVGYVTECWQNSDGKYLPSAGSCDRTAGQLLAELQKYKRFEDVFGTPNSECGAWIRFNPMDGKGAKNENVADYRYALVESDKIPIEQQNGILHDLKLPIAALVFSGGKSLHAIVRVDAGSYEEYRRRVEFLYSVCDKNGLQVDRQNRNPSRLSRMPGVERKGQKQYLLETDIGFSTFSEWRDYIDSITDDLPELENMADAWEHMPALAPPLIGGVLRQGHKMLIAGPSKAGKSYALIEMCIAIAEGRPWLGWPCAKGRVLYVNLELDRASCLHRFRDVYDALHLPPVNLNAIDIWNLRGVTEPMDKLAPKLIRRAKKGGYIAVVIDPIYKVITGDENSADQMAHFCNQFDKICTQLGCAVIYCHHHSKGAQGGKRSMDRASGSGVFARDPDALLDMTELELTEDILTQQKNTAACRICEAFLTQYAPGVLEDAAPDDLMSRKAAEALCRRHLPQTVYSELCAAPHEADRRTDGLTAWRLEGTLREFPKFAPKNLWFRYPIHEEDMLGVLRDLQLDVQLAPYQRGARRGHATQKKQAKAAQADKSAELLNVFDTVNVDGRVTVQDIAEFLGVTEKTVRNRLDKCDGLEIVNGEVKRTK